MFSRRIWCGPNVISPFHLYNIMTVFLKSANFVSFTDKNVKCPTEIKILSVRMSDIKI